MKHYRSFVTPGCGSPIGRCVHAMENAMLRIFLFFASLAACTPSPQDAAMRKTSPVLEVTAQGSGEIRSQGQGLVVPSPTGQDGDDRQKAAQGPIAEPVSAAENLAPAIPVLVPAVPANLSADAVGRRTLSTAFVMVGPDGHLTVELRSGRVLLLRDVVMHPKDYCGRQVLGGLPGKRYCGSYADVGAARPGGIPIADDASATSIGPEPNPSHRE